MRDLFDASEQCANKQYWLVTSNCYYFVGELIEKMGLPKEQVKAVFDANTCSVSKAAENVFMGVVGAVLAIGMLMTLLLVGMAMSVMVL